MREKPMLFSGPMILALLAGRKSQTRRLVKGEALNWLESGLTPEFTASELSPYKDVDQLWMRENIRAVEREDGRDGVLYMADQHWKPIENSEEAGDRWSTLFHYDPKRRPPGSEIPCIHMPRWTCRITRPFLGSRIERLNDCSEADAIAEGVFPAAVYGGQVESWLPAEHLRERFYPTAATAYRSLWGHINGADSWSANPWVWVHTFGGDA